MTVTINGTTGISTPADTIAGGNLTFTGTGNRITGDFSNATWANKVLFQSSTTNGQTAVGLLPNGTSTQSQFIAFNGIDPSNSSYVQALISATDARFNSGQLGTGTNLPMTFYTGGSERLRLDTSGNLGLGVTPSAANIATIQSAYGALIGNNQANIGVNAYYNAGWKYIGTGAATLYTQNTGNSPGGHDWRVAPSGTAGNAISFTQAMTLDASGNLGIGTSSPQNKLDVNGGIRIGYGSPLTCYAGSNVTENTVLNNYYDSNGNDTLLLKPSGVSGGGQILFAGRTGTERMRIDSSGNLLVGTTITPTTSGTAGVSISQGSSIGYIFLGKTYSGSTDAMRFYYNGGGSSVQVGSIVYSNTGTTYNTSSDYRLKENIQPMQNALGVVAQLNPVTYNWKADGSDGQGFIAHELQAVVPDCVTGEKDAVDKEGKPVYQGIDTSFLVATLCKAIQELEARVKQLEGK